MSLGRVTRSDHIGHHQTVTLCSYFNDALILVTNPKTAKFTHNRQTVYIYQQQHHNYQ